MSDSKKYNSIVFLTTLSVYLGLVLVGGAGSPVLAQAAMTRNFDIQEEIECKDDLDKKPDDELDFNKTLDEYFKDLDNFIEDLQKLHQIEKFDIEFDTFELDQSNLFPCTKEEGNKVGITELAVNSIGNKWLRPAIDDLRSQLTDYYYLADCQLNLGQELNKKLKVSDYFSNLNYNKATESGFQIKYDGEFLKIVTSLKKESPQRAKQFIEKFNQVFNTYEFDDENKVVRQLLQFIIIKSENNQVFIITNLPRASIDSLLAVKDAN